MWSGLPEIPLFMTCRESLALTCTAAGKGPMSGGGIKK